MKFRVQEFLLILPLNYTGLLLLTLLHIYTVKMLFFALFLNFYNIFKLKALLRKLLMAAIFLLISQ